MFQTYQEIFSQRADLYHDAMKMCPNARDEEFQQILEQALVEDGMSVLDMPAGGGYFRRHLPDDIRYVAIETAPYFLERCPIGPGNERHLCQLNALPLDDSSIDYAVSMAALHHEPDVAGVFREVRRVLKPSARFIAADVEQGTATAEFLNGFVDAHNSMGHEGAFLNENTRTLLADAGFEIASDRSIEFCWYFESEDEMGRFAKSLFGLDKASVGETIFGIERILGHTKSDSGVAMNWHLAYIACVAD